MNKFSDILKKKIQEAKNNKLSYRDLAKAIGIGTATLLQYTHGDTLPESGKLKKVCTYFKLNEKEMAELIWNERREKKLERFAEKCDYPEIRVILLSLYRPDYSVNNKNFLSRPLIERKLNRQSLHNIERRLLDIISAELIKNGSFKKLPNEIDFKDYLDRLTFKNKKKLISKSNIRWSFNDSLHQLIIERHDSSEKFQVSATIVK